MKELTRYNRIASYLNKCYDLLNADFFNGEMERPVITIQSTPKAFAHITLYEAWTVRGTGFQEINIGAGTLDRPIENVAASLAHEMTHQHNFINKISDVSRNGTYHNKRFKETAEARGLLKISQHPIYGWSITEPGEKLIEFVLNNDLLDIELNRNELQTVVGISGGIGRTDGGEGLTRKGSYRKHTCNSCGLIARTTKDATLICADCGIAMVSQ